ncbi:MAG: L-lactate dehydrogenase [Eubacteriales bacterium]|nr:L-lactate dehydrogenase [Eubacteriales bacterium]
MKTRKVGIVGVGHVGAHTAYSLAIQGIADEIVLVDTNKPRVGSEFQDLFDSIPYMPNRVHLTNGTYEDLEDCDVIVNSAGDITLLLGSEDRSRELRYTVPCVHTWADQLGKTSFDGIIVNISNPCDVVTREIALATGLPKGHVLGTGTGLDTARLVSQIAEATHVNAHSIQAYMIGEHGNSMFAGWSAVTMNGLPLDEFLDKYQDAKFDKAEIEQLGRHGGWVTFSYKHATEYAIATTAAKMVKAILHDERIIMPASTELTGEYGQNGVFVGVPVLLGKNGVEQVIELSLTDEELDKLNDSCNAIRANMALADEIEGRA